LGVCPSNNQALTIATGGAISTNGTTDDAG